MKKMKFQEVPRITGNGFTMVELLCIIVILVAISLMLVVGASRMFLRDRKEVRSNEQVISEAAESYLQANSDATPGTIGGVTRLTVPDLREANYITSDIVDESGQSCMKDSYVRVYKYSKTQYTFTPYIYCGNEKPATEEMVPKPNVEVKFQDDEKRTYGTLIDIGTTAIRINISGGVNTDGSELRIDGYNYAVFVKLSSSNDFQEVYNSGAVSVDEQNRVSIEKMVSEFVDDSNVADVAIKLTVRNKAGGLKEIIVNLSNQISS